MELLKFVAERYLFQDSFASGFACGKLYLLRKYRDAHPLARIRAPPTGVASGAGGGPLRLSVRTGAPPLGRGGFLVLARRGASAGVGGPPHPALRATFPSRGRLCRGACEAGRRHQGMPPYGGRPGAGKVNIDKNAGGFSCILPVFSFRLEKSGRHQYNE